MPRRSTLKYTCSACKSANTVFYRHKRHLLIHCHECLYEWRHDDFQMHQLKGDSLLFCLFHGYWRTDEVQSVLALLRQRPPPLRELCVFKGREVFTAWVMDDRKRIYVGDTIESVLGYMFGDIYETRVQSVSLTG